MSVGFNRLCPEPLCTRKGPEGISIGYNVRNVGTLSDTQQKVL